MKHWIFDFRCNFKNETWGRRREMDIPPRYLHRGDIWGGGYPIPQYSKKNWQILIPHLDPFIIGQAYLKLHPSRMFYYLMHVCTICPFIKSILKSLVVPVIWLAQIGAIYSQIAPFFALNHIIFPANEEVTLQTCRLSRRFRERLRYTQ